MKPNDFSKYKVKGGYYHPDVDGFDNACEVFLDYFEANKDEWDLEDQFIIEYYFENDFVDHIEPRFCELLMNWCEENEGKL